ncbi:MAG TPA: hypothetical protein VGM56_06115 [Byssovorax sp.]
MSSPRRRRWMDVLRRTTGVGAEGRQPSGALEDAALWAAHEQAARALEDAGARAERVAASLARQRAVVEGASERASLVASRAEALGVGVARVHEAFERLGVVALNAGLEGSRVAEPQGRALLLLSEEVRANVARGADAARQLAASVDELTTEAGIVRRDVERSRAEVADVGQDAAQLRAGAEQAAKALDELAQRLKRATGIDPEVARAVSLASDHARGLMTALSSLSAAGAPQAVAVALRPVIVPLARLLGELDPGDDGDDGDAT